MKRTFVLTVLATAAASAPAVAWDGWQPCASDQALCDEGGDPDETDGGRTYDDYPPGYPFGQPGNVNHPNGYDGWPGDTDCPPRHGVPNGSDPPDCPNGGPGGTAYEGGGAHNGGVGGNGGAGGTGGNGGHGANGGKGGNGGCGGAGTATEPNGLNGGIGGNSLGEDGAGRGGHGGHGGDGYQGGNGRGGEGGMGETELQTTTETEVMAAQADAAAKARGPGREARAVKVARAETAGGAARRVAPQELAAMAGMHPVRDVVVREEREARVEMGQLALRTRKVETAEVAAQRVERGAIPDQEAARRTPGAPGLTTRTRALDRSN